MCFSLDHVNSKKRKYSKIPIIQQNLKAVQSSATTSSKYTAYFQDTTIIFRQLD